MSLKDMHELTRFFIYTRGRTGSTAIIDEMNFHPDITCWQELFIELSNDPMVADFYRRHGVNFADYEIKMHWHPTFDLWRRQFRQFQILNKHLYLYGKLPVTAARMVRYYLNSVEETEHARSKRSVGFKLLENQAENTPGLVQALKRSNYKAIYLERVNVVRRVISGIIASKRKVYNKLNYKPPDDAYIIDLEEFRGVVHVETEAVKWQKAMLEEMRFPVLYITYEEFIDNREEFYNRIFDFLGVDSVLPQATAFSIMIPDIRNVIENYEEFYRCVKDMGYESMLS